MKDLGKNINCPNGRDLVNKLREGAIHRCTKGILASGLHLGTKRKVKLTQGSTRKGLNKQLTSIYGCKIIKQTKLPDASTVLVSNNQRFLLSSHWSGEKIDFAQLCATYLRRKGFRGGGTILNTKTGKSSFRRNGQFYYLQTYVGGTKVKLATSAQATSLFRLLGQIHKYGESFTWPEWRVPPKAFPFYPQALRQGLEYLEEVYRKVLQSRHRSVFDELFLDSYGYFKEQGDWAICKIEQSGITDLLDQLSTGGNICYPSLEWRRVRFWGNGKAMLSDYTGCQLGLPVYDVSILLIKTLTEYGWSSTLQSNCLRAYQDVREITEIERSILHGLMVFPANYWQVVYNYYQSRQFNESSQAIMYCEISPEMVIRFEAKLCKLMNSILEQEGDRKTLISELMD